MNRLLKTTSLLALVSAPFCANAQSPTDFSNFSPRLKLQSRYSLYDSYRNNQSDLITNTARFGLNYRYKNVMGVLEVQAGSPSDTYTQASKSSTTTGSSTTSTTNGSQNLFQVRRAFIGLELVNMEPATVSLIMGRYRFVASQVYAPDAITQILATNLDNVSSSTSSDGLIAKYAGKFDFGKVGAEFGVVNNIAVAKYSTGSSWFGNTSIVSSDNSFSAAPKTQSRGMQGVLTGDIDVGDGTVEARFGYGMQNGAVTSVSASTYTNQDVTNLEASAGYNYMKGQIKGGVWYQAVTLAKAQTGTIVGVNNVPAYTTVTSPTADQDSQNISTIGVGVTGNSKLFGITGLLADGDAFTYGIGYQNVNGQEATGGGSNGVTAFTNQSLQISQYNVGVGYNQGVFNLELNYAMSSANYEIYTNNDGVAKEKTASIVYLVGTISL
ncbi:hypothetical protein QEJ31_11870 [Pigmentibacter sp. JX0631]|uniref:hypothetical protein n=1 Tax=Pigmentibacter sp. JX0631 TaxID=2976982 RepID=UPI002468D9DF|nr:hypothetical protein [Pigmentibacter sp. JX0631]WGL59219.1 hypothetical protein QEJ31_11870 [Pigmentibacter sp. JX0631]